MSAPKKAATGRCCNDPHSPPRARHPRAHHRALPRPARLPLYLGNWIDRADNRNIEHDLLSAWLAKRGYSKDLAGRAIHALRTAADNFSRKPYDNNQEVYELLRYGAQVKLAAGENTETVHLIDWEKPNQNDFAIAEEVTLKGGHERRPDLVLYINGIAFAVIELKKSTTTIGDGIRQLLSNQHPEFNAWFFSTVQLVFAGNNSEGLQYGTIGTEEKYFLRWKKDQEDNQATSWTSTWQRCATRSAPLTHLIDPTHSDRFRAILSRHLPNWPHLRAQLNRALLAHEDWEY